MSKINILQAQCRFDGLWFDLLSEIKFDLVVVQLPFQSQIKLILNKSQIHTVNVMTLFQSFHSSSHAFGVRGS